MESKKLLTNSPSRQQDANNIIFYPTEFQAHIDANMHQGIDFSGTRVHHQNGVAEHDIQTVPKGMRTMLLPNVFLHWLSTGPNQST